MKKWLALLGVFTLGFISHLYLVYVLKPDIKPTYSVSTVGEQVDHYAHASTVPPQKPAMVSNPNLFVGYIKIADINYIADKHPQNRVFIEDLLSNREAGYALNSHLPYGGKVIEIHQDKIVIQKDRQYRVMELLERADDPAARRAILERGYHRVADREWILMPDHLHLDKSVEQSLLATEISPHFVKGTQRFRIDDLPEGSLFAELGFEQGDSITSIDGEVLSDIQHILRICWKIRKSSLVSVGLERDHRPLTLSYRIIDGV